MMMCCESPQLATSNVAKSIITDARRVFLEESVMAVVCSIFISVTPSRCYSVPLSFAIDGYLYY